MSTKEKITEKKQFRELSDEELEKVNGGGPHDWDLDRSCGGSIPPECKKKIMDEYGCLICISF